MNTNGTRALQPLQRTIYIGTFLHCVSLSELEVLETTAVGVDEHGIIAFIEPSSSSDIQAIKEKHGWTEHTTIQNKSNGIGFFFPGFVDTHIHASQFPNAGIFGKTTLLSWLHKYTFPLEASLSSLPKARAVYSRVISRTLAHGTTTASYFATIHAESTQLLASLCHASGQRAFVGRCEMDSAIHPAYYRDTSPETAIAATKASIAHVEALDPTFKLLSPILTPRFAPSCSAELMSALGQLARATGLPVQTHISENEGECQLVRELHPAHGSYADVYDHHGLLTPRTVLAHGIHLSLHERKLVKARGSSISHCPVSNSCLGSGIAPVRELLDEGIAVGLGTDVSGGYSPSVLAAAREAGSVSRLRAIPGLAKGLGEEERDRLKLSVEETLFLATRGGARALGLEERVGGFAVGMEWDAQFVDLGQVVQFDGTNETGGKGNVHVWKGMDWEETVAKWVFCGDDRNTRAVWVAGRLVSGDMEA